MAVVGFNAIQVPALGGQVGNGLFHVTDECALAVIAAQQRLAHADGNHALDKALLADPLNILLDNGVYPNHSHRTGSCEQVNAPILERRHHAVVHLVGQVCEAGHG